jgi:hypothetical protein
MAQPAYPELTAEVPWSKLMVSFNRTECWLLLLQLLSCAYVNAYLRNRIFSWTGRDGVTCCAFSG